MTRTTLKRGGAALLAFSLAFVGLSFVFSQPISAHAEETAKQKASLEVTFDFDSLPSNRPTFKDMVRVYQWSVDKKTKKDQAISKDTKTISLTPLGDDKTINFYVYVGKDQGYGPEISDRDLYSFSGKKAKTAELSNVHVGRSLELSFANLMDSKDSLPEIPTDASLYEPLFLEEPNTPDSFSSIEQGASELVLPRVMFKPKNGVPLIKVPSGDFSLSLKTTPFGAEVINPGYLRLGPIDIDAQLGKHNINVEITYADGSKESATASFIVTEKLTPELESQLWDISYPDLTLEQREHIDLSVKATLFGKERALPRAVTFAPSEDVPSWVKINKNTGTLTITPDEYTEPRNYTFQILITHLDGSTGLYPVNITITKADNAPELKSQLWKLSYADTTVQQLKSASVDLTATLFGKERALPRAVTFAKGADMPSWITVDPKTGEVTANPDEYVAAQDYEFTVAVTHLDGEVTTVPVKITITKADNAPELKSQLWKLSYADTTVQQLKSASVDLTATLFGKERALPRAVTFAKGADMPSWITVDPKTGEVTANPDEYVAAQDYEFTVAVTHLDGEVTTVPVKITITKADNAPELKSQLWKLSYADTTVQQLKSASVDLTATLFGKERALPRAVTFAKGADMPSWVMVDEKTGTITVKPSEYVELKDYVFHVVVTHLDGKTEKVAVKIKVIEADPETTYPLTPLKPGKHTIPALELTPAQPNAKPQTPKPVETPSTGLAKTGISLTGLAGLALISTLTGATIARRRHAN